MKKLIIRGYGIAVILFTFLFFYGLLSLRLSTWRKDALTGYGEITDYSYSVEKVALCDEAPLGKRAVLEFNLANIRSDFNTLLFLTAHENVTVSVGGREVYHLGTKRATLAPKSPGVVYNEVIFKDSDNGKTVRIELYPVYEGVLTPPDLMLGNGYQIVKVILFSNLPILGLCFTVILIGVLQIVFALLNAKTEEHLNIALSHSAFTILVGFWKLLDSDFIALFGKSLPVLSILSFVIMMFLPIMLTKFVRDTLDAYKSFVWQIPEFVTLLSILIMLAFQFFGVADFRDSIWITEVDLAIAFLCMFVGVGISIHDSGWNKNTKAGLGCTCLSLFWMVVDLYTYFKTSGVTNFPFTMLLFLIFLLTMVGHRLRVSKKDMEVGMKARQYKKLAYHDALTGFFNRAAYADFLNSSEFNPKNNVFVAFDLNNLKKCNDQLGHDKGDIYIKEAARIIMDCFGENGRCYRLGGDEFGAILLDDDLNTCARKANKMMERVKKFNHQSSDIQMGIACGYAVFDPKEDEDIHATIRRADKMMYEEKFKMKQQAEA
ncbi:MAG: GGDEF domain-containing protein [Lachnospiraceae bacterium]|nr:GGDEF domain-containing protein [Lachnospiraceae bacterium]